jgi:cytochrome c oxidase subunit 4
MADTHHKEPNYIAIWGWLLLLTITEVATTRLPIPRLTMAILLVGQALTKALLVAMYFMHLKFEKRTLGMIALSPLILCVFLSLMLLPDSKHDPNAVQQKPPAAAAPAEGEGHAETPEETTPPAPEGH